MALIGRSFPSHTVSSHAGVSNVIQTLTVVCPTSLRMMKTKSFKITAVSATNAIVRPLKLAGYKVIKATTATSSTIGKTTGKGRILKVTSATNKIVTRNTTKTLRATSATSASFRKSITKIIRKSQASVASVFPGIFRTGPTTGNLVVQSRPFNLIMQSWRALFDN